MKVPKSPALQLVDLTSLSIGSFQNNQIGEGRAFLSNRVRFGSDLTGFANARWDEKYKYLQTKLSDLPAFCRQFRGHRVVLAPWTTDWPGHGHNTNWMEVTLHWHPSMEPLLLELSELTCLSLDGTRRSLWANDFIASSDVAQDWLNFWRFVFAYFHGRYGFKLPFLPDNLDGARQCAYFYERVTALYFSHAMNVNIIQIP